MTFLQKKIAVLFILCGAIFGFAADLNDKFILADYNFNDSGKLDKNCIVKGSSLKCGPNVKYSSKGVSGGALDYTPRKDTLIKQTLLTLPQSIKQNKSFTIDFHVKMRSASIGFGRDMYLLGGTRLFFRYAIDRHAFDFGLNAGKKWFSVSTPLNKFTPKKNTWYHLVGVYDGSQISFYVDDKLIGSKKVEGEFNPYPVLIGTCGWSNNLKYEGDFLMDDLVISRSPVYVPKTNRSVADKKVSKPQKTKSVCKFIERPFLVIPKISSAPSINGKPFGGEWEKAAWACNPVFRGDKFISDKLNINTGILWDDKALYVGFRCYGKRSPIATTTGKGDDGLERDDAVEIMLWIPGKSQPKKPFQFKLNCEGFRDDAIRFDFCWNVPWDGAVAKNGNNWSATFRIPFSSIGVTPKVGTRWNANFSGFLMGCKYTAFSWSPNYLHHHFNGEYGTIEFGGKTTPSSAISSIRKNVSVIETSGYMSDRGMVRVLLIPESGKSQSRGKLGNYVITDFDKVGKNAIAQTTEKLAKPGKWSVKLPPVSPGQYWVKAMLYNQHNQLVNKECKPVIIENSLDVKVKRYPVRRAAGIWVTAYNMGEQGVKPDELSVQLLDDSGRIVKNINRRMTRLGIRQMLVVDGLKNGMSYTAKIVVTSKNRKNKLTHQTKFTLPERPPWADTRAGLGGGKVPAPWTPIKISKQTLSCWGRTHTVNKSLLPQSIVSSGKPVLGNGGMSILAESRGHDEKISRAEKAPVIKVSATGDKAEYKAQSKGKLCDVKVDASLEFDGFMTFDLKVEPHKPLSRLSVDIPLSSAVAKYLQPVLNSGNRDILGKMPSKGYSLDLITPFWPLSSIWISSDDAGLFFATETTKGWIAPKGKMVQFIPQGKDMLMRLNFYWDKKAFKKPRAWRFYIQTTPVKPYPDDYYEKGSRIMHGFQLTHPRTAIEPDSVKAVNLNKMIKSPNWAVDLSLSSDKDMKKLQAMEPVYGLHYVDKVLQLCSNNGAITVQYDNRKGSMMLRSRWGTIAPKNNVSWKPGESHLISIVKDDKLKFYIDGRLQGELPLKNAEFKSAMLYLGSVNARYTLHKLRVRSGKQAIRQIAANSTTIKKSPDTLLFEDKKLYLKSNARTLLDKLADQGVKVMIYFEYWSHMQAGGSSRWEALIKDAVEECHKRGIKLILYFGFEIAEVPEQQNYIDESIAFIDKSSKYYLPAKMNTYIVSYGGPYMEYILYNMERLKKEIGIDGVYLDGTLGMSASDNPAFNCGIPNSDGSRTATVPVRRIRQLARRIYNLFIPDGGVVYAHLTTTPPTSGFVTCQYFGEHLGFRNRDWKAMSDLITDEAARAIYTGKNTGVTTSLCLQLMWPHLASKKPRWYEKAAAWCNLYRSAVPSLAPVPKSWKQNDMELHRKRELSEFGASKAKWYPYWEISGQTVSNPKSLRMSVWQRKDGAMLWAIQNNGPEHVKGNIGLKGKLAIKPGFKAQKLLDGSKVTIKDGGVDVDILPYEGTLVLIKQ